MDATQAKPGKTRWPKVLLRIAIVVAAATIAGTVMSHTAARMERDRGPAGFPRGVMQGALMPCALPSLLMGRDVIIYTENNNGIRYKLGYTFGVNACGAVFFGIFFWRINRWRKRLNGKA